MENVVVPRLFSKKKIIFKIDRERMRGVEVCMKTIIAFLGAITALLVGCGDEVTKTVEMGQSSIPVVDSGEKIPACDSTKVGDVVYVTDSSTVFYCTGDSWLAMKGNAGTPGKSCSISKVEGGYGVWCGGDSVGVLSNGLQGKPGEKGNPGVAGESCRLEDAGGSLNVFCGDELVGVLKNGTDGDKGEDGVAGDSCTVLPIENGFEVYCGKQLKGTISNGANGGQGEKGEKGNDCFFVDNGDGTVTQTCGESNVILYKAVCGETPFDPAGDKFCYGVELVDKCNGAAYDIKVQECVGGEIRNL